jgi:hypothetical protein
VFFDRSVLDQQLRKAPRRTIAGHKIFHEFNPSHRYGSGHDVAGGVGLDSSTSVFIDFATLPNKVVATYANNTIKPDIFGDEVARQGSIFGECLVAPENNNYGAATIGRLKQIYENIFVMEQFSGTAHLMERKDKTYGWSTNGATKTTMLMDLRSAVEDGHLELSDPALIAELRSYMALPTTSPSRGSSSTSTTTEPSSSSCASATSSGPRRTVKRLGPKRTSCPSVPRPRWSAGI